MRQHRRTTISPGTRCHQADIGMIAIERGVLGIKDDEIQAAAGQALTITHLLTK